LPRACHVDLLGASVTACFFRPWDQADMPRWAEFASMGMTICARRSHLDRADEGTAIFFRRK
jgi:hypothetical protein